jgi:HAD superfamily hydrolase (TIGR01458 family)
MKAAGVLLDIDGVIVRSWRPIPGALEAIERLHEHGVPLRFVTNTTSRSATEMLAVLQSIGIEMSAAHLITAGTATAAWIRREHRGARCYVLNDGSAADLADLEIVGDDAGESADVVIVGSGGPCFTWDRMNTALRALRSGAALVAMHGSTLWDTVDGACLDCGAYARMLAEAAHVEPLVVGKPAAELFLAAASAMGVDPGDAVMVGDDVNSDVLAAQHLGMTGVLVRTGKYRAADVEAAPGEPDHVIDSLAELPAILGLA